ncbi:MAG: apolipoprotein N-acyltransferase [Methylophaga sp.]|nr:MAG: apolipoprotein N-acyltransferase [Methylophaga sp.]
MQTRFLGWQGTKGNIIALIAGGVLPLAFAPFYYYLIAIVSLALLFLSWQGVSAKQAAMRGFLFGVGLFGVGVSWVYVAIHDFGQASLLLAGLLTGLFVGFLALYLAFFAWLGKRITVRSLNVADFVLLLPIIWLIFEVFKGWFLTGFPWLDIGVSQIEGPLSGYIPIIGVLGASWLVAVTAGLIIALWQTRRWYWGMIIVVIWGGGSLLQQQQWTTATDDRIKTSLIQGNIPQATKWDPKQLFKTLALYQARTEQHWDSDLIVWPENAVTAFHHQLKDLYFDPLAEQARANKTDILLGLPVKDISSQQYFNSMMLLGSDQAFYYKSHLVPFGDYVPLEWLRGLIAFFDLPMSAFRPGPIQQELIHAAGYNIGISICYEDTFSTEILRSVPQANLLVNATNNAWYGDSFAPHQHLQISRSRALETERPILRATTNGISAIIGFKGKLIKQTEQFQEQVLTGWVQPREGATPYVRWGQKPIFVLSLFMLMVWAYYRRITVVEPKN